MSLPIGEPAPSTDGPLVNPGYFCRVDYNLEKCRIWAIRAYAIISIELGDNHTNFIGTV